jgi:hypothetical protein
MLCIGAGRYVFTAIKEQCIGIVTRNCVALFYYNYEIYDTLIILNVEIQQQRT